MNNIYLLRHGETDNNVQCITQPTDYSVPLNASALDELNDNMHDIVSVLAGKPTYILCSPMHRTVQTVIPIVQELRNLSTHMTDVHMTIDSRLREVDFGDFGGQHESHSIDGSTMDDYRQTMQQCCVAIHHHGRNRNCMYPNGESLLSIRNRCKGVINSICQINKDNDDVNIVIVGHNRLFRHLLVELGEWEPEKMFAEKLPHAKLVKLSNVTSICMELR